MFCAIQKMHMTFLKFALIKNMVMPFQKTFMEKTGTSFQCRRQCFLKVFLYLIKKHSLTLKNGHMFSRADILVN